MFAAFLDLAGPAYYKMEAGNTGSAAEDRKERDPTLFELCDKHHILFSASLPASLSSFLFGISKEQV